MSYAPLDSVTGRQRTGRLEKRAAFLRQRIAASHGDLSFDRAEESAIAWAIAKLSELRDRLDRVAALVDAEGNDSLAEKVHAAAKENPPTTTE